MRGAEAAVAERVAPASWRTVDLLSDLHLSPALPRTFDAWARYLRGTDADAVFILGDLFEAWVGDDQRLRPFEQSCVQVLRDTAARRVVAFMAGNRDFLLGESMRADCGLERLEDPTVLLAFGRRVLLTHGDALCVDDAEYQRFREASRGRDWQRRFLALPLEERLGRVAAVRSASDARRRGSTFDPTQWADVDRRMALEWLDRAGAATMIHGHTHRPGRVELDSRRDRHVLSDWELDHDPARPRGDVLRLSAGGIERRCLPSGPG